LTGPGPGGALGSPGAGDLVEVDQVTGQVHSDLIKQARDAIEQAPDDAAAVVRGWLQQG
jgi:flagellar biosynthesis/type III secretory pathway M-ring protein FliF/YscJ